MKRKPRIISSFLILLGVIALLLGRPIPAQAQDPFPPGTVMFAEQGTGRLVALPPDQTEVELATGLQQPRGVAFGPDGNVYVTEQTAQGTLKRITPGGEPGSGQVIRAGLSFPGGLAVMINLDGSLSFLVSEFGGSRLVRISAEGGHLEVLASDLNGPTGVTVAPNGDIFVAEFTTGNLIRLSLDGSRSRIAAGFAGPIMIAAGPNGLIYVTETTAGQITEVNPETGEKRVVVGGFPGLVGIAVDTQTTTLAGAAWAQAGRFTLLATVAPHEAKVALGENDGDQVLRIDQRTGAFRVLAKRGLTINLSSVTAALFYGPDPRKGVNYGPPVYTTRQREPERTCGCTKKDSRHGGDNNIAVIVLDDICPLHGNLIRTGQDAGRDAVYLHNGEFYVYEVDLEIPGRGFNWKFERKYRSGIIFNGPMGHNWEFNYNRRLFEAVGGDVLRMDGYGRADRYEVMGGGYRAPAGFYTRLVQNRDGTFVERDRRGTKVFYSAPDGLGVARMTEIRDRNGNQMRFEYNDRGQLIRVIDTLGRPIDYFYNAQGRLIEVQDFSGRSIKFAYDENGGLVAVTSPTVKGTPNGNDFPQGKTTRYTYSSGFAEDVLNHNMLTTTAPNEVASGGEPRIRVEYNTDPNSLNMDRVLSQTIGGTNAQADFAKGQLSIRQGSGVPAGGTIRYEYTFLGMVTEDDFVTPVTQTTVIDRNGNRTEYQFNQIGNIVRTREFTNRNIRSSDPEFFETRYEYNPDGEITRMIYPEGNSVQYVYDDQSGDRLQQGNLLAEIRRPDPERGGDQEFLRTSHTYEPIYNRERSVTEARGNDPDYIPQNGGATSLERYTTVRVFDYQEGQDFRALADELGVNQRTVRNMLREAGVQTRLGDINGDGRTDQIAGNVIRVDYPTVTLLADSNMAQIEGGTQQPIVDLRTYNQFGQMTRRGDPEGNVHVYEYHPENDPDGDGRDQTPDVSDSPFGYLKEEIRDAESNPIRNSGTDPGPTRIRRQYLYDRVGNVTQRTDGRGIATDYVVNELNQVVQVVRAAAHNLFVPDPQEPLPLVNFQYLQRIFYDFNNNVIRRQVEDRGNTSSVGGDNSGAAFVDYEYQYDILDNRVEMSEEVSDSEDLITRTRYDRNENRVLVIQPEGNATSTVYDERDLAFQRTRGAPSPPALALLAAGDPTGFDVRGGVPSTMTYHYDLNRNLNEEVDADDTDGSAANNSKRGGMGDRTRYIYDGFDRRTSVIDSVGNQTVTQYDPAGNMVRVSRFGPVGGESPTSDGPDALPMPVSSDGVIQAANLVSRDLLAASERRYDELSRVFQTDNVLFVNTIPTVRPPDVADGAADIDKGNLTPGDNQGIPGVTGITTIGRVTTRAEYDRNSRRTFTVEDDLDIFRRFYDGADRVIKTVDPEGNIVETAYDDNDNVIETRETDVSQVAGVADEVFLTTYFYDSLDRLERRVDNIGQTYDYRYDSRDNVVAMADAQGPAGPAVTRRAFQGGALTDDTSNRFGNVTLYSYDGINRRTRQDVILTASGQGDGVNIGADFLGVKTATPTPDPSQSGDGLITIRTDWDRNSLLISQTDDNGNQTEFSYDNLNRRLTETKGICVPPALADRCDLPTTIIYEYNPDDNVFRLTDENGSTVNCQFDAINRRIACSITRAPGVVGTTARTYEYDGLSRLTHAMDNNEPHDSSDDSTITFAYDSLSRVIEETQQIGDLSAKAISSAWRTENLKTGCIYPNDRKIQTTFDKLDRIDRIADNGPGAKDNGPIVDYVYIGKHRVAERRYPINGTRLTYLDNTSAADVGYDGLRRPGQLRHLRADNSLIVGFGYSYDRMNNKLIEEKLHAPSDSELYSYDSAYRLTRFERGDLNSDRDVIAAPSPNVPLHSDWTLDGVGNWRQVDGETREHSSFNEITVRNDGAPTTILSDDNGNMTDDGAFAITWDHANRLRSVTRKADGVVIAGYSYDAADRRIRKVVTNSGVFNGKTDFYYDGSQVVEERDGANALVQQYVYGVYVDEPLVLDRNLGGGDSAIGPGDERLFYHQNTLYSIFALTDMSGTIAEGYQYDAYGHHTIFGLGANGVVDFGVGDVIMPAGQSTRGNRYLFTGRRYDPETGRHYYRTRYLDPPAGRFTSRDSIGTWNDTLNLGNGYTYVANNPQTLSDPYGEFGSVTYWGHSGFFKWFLPLRIAVFVGAYAGHKAGGAFDAWLAPKETVPLGGKFGGVSEGQDDSECCYELSPGIPRKHEDWAWGAMRSLRKAQAFVEKKCRVHFCVGSCGPSGPKCIGTAVVDDVLQVQSWVPFMWWKWTTTIWYHCECGCP